MPGPVSGLAARRPLSRRSVACSTPKHGSTAGRALRPAPGVRPLPQAPAGSLGRCAPTGLHPVYRRRPHGRSSSLGRLHASRPNDTHLYAGVCPQSRLLATTHGRGGPATMTTMPGTPRTAPGTACTKPTVHAQVAATRMEECELLLLA